MNINIYESNLFNFLSHGLFEHGLKMNLCLKSLKRGIDSKVETILE